MYAATPASPAIVAIALYCFASAASIARPNTSAVCASPGTIHSTVAPSGASSRPARSTPAFTGIQNGLLSSPSTTMRSGFAAFCPTGFTVPSSATVPEDVKDGAFAGRPAAVFESLDAADPQPAADTAARTEAIAIECRVRDI